jgi:NDP-sugar pyrophosphorylase family protein
MVEFHDACGAEVTISLTRVDDPSAFGVVPTAGDGAVISFVEKPPRGSAPSNWINAGTYVIEPPFLDRIPPRLNVSVERETFPRLLEQSGRLFGYKTDAYWLDIGTPEKYLQAQLDVMDGRTRGAPVAGRVLRGEGAHIDAGAHVERAVIGARAVIEAGARVENSVLHAGVRVSHGSTVRDSIVGADSVLKPEVALSALTIIGAGVVVPSGSTISGGRLPSDRA